MGKKNKGSLFDGDEYEFDDFAQSEELSIHDKKYLGIAKDKGNTFEDPESVIEILLPIKEHRKYKK